MACSNCGSTLPCPCSQQFQTGVGRTCVDPCGTQQGCNPNDCCSPSLPASPVPFYACVPSCPESHTQTLVQQQFYADISAQNSWNVPLCGATAILAVPGLKSVNIGSYIWNATFGYFEVTAFDVTTGQLTVLNHCNDGNAATGTTVPACTLFTVTVPPCDCGTSTQVCVAIDFTAPAIGDCIDITLTDTVGLQDSDTVQIGTGFYFLQTIKPNNIVTICNQGDGILAGTPVIAKDANGNYQYCLSIISSNACMKDPIAAGRVLVCDGSGNLAPLTGGSAGEILTLTNPVNGDATYDNTIPTAIVTLQTNINDLAAAFYSNVTDYADSTPHIIDSTGGSTSYTTPHTNWNITNSSTTKNLIVTTTFNFILRGDITGDPINNLDVTIKANIFFSVNGTGPFSVGQGRTTNLDNVDDFYAEDFEVLYSVSDTIPPGGTHTYEMWGFVDSPVIGTFQGGIYTTSDIRIQAAQIGVPG